MPDSPRKGIIEKLKEIDRKGSELLSVDQSRFIPYSPSWGNMVYQINKVTAIFEIEMLMGGGALLLLMGMILYYGLTTMDWISIIFPLILIPIFSIPLIIAMKNISQPTIYVFENGIYYPHAYHGKLKWENTFIPFYELNDLHKIKNRIVLTTTSGKYNIHPGKFYYFFE